MIKSKFIVIKKNVNKKRVPEKFLKIPFHKGLKKAFKFYVLIYLFRKYKIIKVFRIRKCGDFLNSTCLFCFEIKKEIVDFYIKSLKKVDFCVFMFD